MTTEDELAAMVAIYNQHEQDQQARLQMIYDALDARRGYRQVRFGDGGGGTVAVWSNCWNQERADLATRSFITPMARLINGYDAGEAD